MVPGARKLAVIDVVPQARADMLPQLPVINSIAGLVKLLPILLSVIVGLRVCAVNLYHTS